MEQYIWYFLGTYILSLIIISGFFGVRVRGLDKDLVKQKEDFLSIDNLEWNGDIITNPPYKYAQEFIEKALQIIPEGNKVAMFLKVQFLEGKGRKKLFLSQPPKTVYVSNSAFFAQSSRELET